jgi:surface protein
MFSNCYSLKSVPLFNTVSVTNMSSMFSGCLSLKSVPLFNTASVTTMSNMFLNCSSLESIPSFNMSSINAAGLTSFAANTINLTNLTINVPVLNSINNFFYSTSVITMPNQGNPLFEVSSTRVIKNININCSGVSSASTNFVNSPFGPGAAFTNVTSIILTGLKYSITPSSAPLSFRLDGIALDALYTSLGTAVGSQTFTVTANHGTVDDNPSIATAKGWTVSGS